MVEKGKENKKKRGFFFFNTRLAKSSCKSCAMLNISALPKSYCSKLIFFLNKSFKKLKRKISNLRKEKEVF
jgi:hypothetical protein